MVSHRTFTPERAICVDALAINARVIEALVNICKRKINRKVIYHQSGTKSELKPLGVNNLLFGHLVPADSPHCDRDEDRPLEMRIREKNTIVQHLNLLSGFCPLRDGEHAHSLLWWGKFHRGLPSLDLAFQYSSTPPWSCSEASEPGSVRFQTSYSSSSHGNLPMDTR